MDPKRPRASSPLGAGRAIPLALLCGFAAACVAPELRPAQDDLRGVGRIAVVAMEPPPLEVLWAEVPAVDPVATPVVVLSSRPGVPTVGGMAVLVGGIFMLASLPESAREGARVAETLDALLESGEAWFPTRALAEVAARRLGARGGVEAVLEPGLARYPGISSRERTFTMENWLAPMRAWYGEEMSTAATERGARPVDAVLEVGLLNFSIYTDQVILQVAVRLVDSRTGRVIGRARALEQATVGRLDEAFADGGSPFKALVTRLGSSLVERSLTTLGLSP